MSSVVNPFERNRGSDNSEKSAVIKLWARQSLPLTDDAVLTVSEFNCAKPSCPNRQTVILVMSEDGPTQKVSIHKTMVDVGEEDVFNACLELLRSWPT